jgi:hypothetical protein
MCCTDVVWEMMLSQLTWMAIPHVLSCNIGLCSNTKVRDLSYSCISHQDIPRLQITVCDTTIFMHMMQSHCHVVGDFGHLLSGYLSSMVDPGRIAVSFANVVMQIVWCPWCNEVHSRFLTKLLDFSVHFCSMSRNRRGNIVNQVVDVGMLCFTYPQPIFCLIQNQ